MRPLLRAGVKMRYLGVWGGEDRQDDCVCAPPSTPNLCRQTPPWGRRGVPPYFPPSSWGKFGGGEWDKGQSFWGCVCPEPCPPPPPSRYTPHPQYWGPAQGKVPPPPSPTHPIKAGGGQRDAAAAPPRRRHGQTPQGARQEAQGRPLVRLLQLQFQLR